MKCVHCAKLLRNQDVLFNTANAVGGIVDLINVDAGANRIGAGNINEGMAGAGGTNIAGLMQQGQQQAAQAVQAAAAPAADTWTCACGSVNTGKFCPNCGAARPAAAACANCGYIFPDPANVPKFCPECGTKQE